MSEPTLVEISSESDYLSQGTQENPINLASENIIESNSSQHSNNSSIIDSKTLWQGDIQVCPIWRDYFKESLSALQCGHIFHYNWWTPLYGLDEPWCPVCRAPINILRAPVELFIDPESLGGNKINGLLRLNRMLEKESRKLICEHEELREQVNKINSQVSELKVLIKQHEASEKDYLCSKEVDYQTKEKYISGVVYTCWTNDECEYYHKFLNVERNLKQSSRSAIQYQKIIRDANTKFMKDTIKYGLTTMNGHYFDTILPFYVQQARKLDYSVDRSEIISRKDLFIYKDDIFEIFNNYGDDYSQDMLKKFQALVDFHKFGTIEKSGDNVKDWEFSALRCSYAQREDEYEKKELGELLEEAYKQINQKKVRIHDEISRIITILKSKSKHKKDCSTQLELLMRQSEFLDKMKIDLWAKKENCQALQINENKGEVKWKVNGDKRETNKSKASRKKTYKQWKSMKHREYK